MTAEPFTPHADSIQTAWVLMCQQSRIATQPPVEELEAEFDRFIARVRRDAVQQFIEACKAKRDEPGFLLPPNYWQDIEAAIRVAESYIKNPPEETP